MDESIEDKCQEIFNYITEHYEKQIDEDIDYIVELIGVIIKKLPLEIERKNIAACGFINGGLKQFIRQRIGGFIGVSEYFEGFEIDQFMLDRMQEKIFTNLRKKLDKINYNEILQMCENRQNIFRESFEQKLFALKTTLDKR